MLSEEKRHALIADCKNLTVSSPFHQIAQIALAALQAKPVAWRVTFDQPLTDDYVSEVAQLWDTEPPLGPYRECSEPLYTASPVQVLQLPDEQILNVPNLMSARDRECYYAGKVQGRNDTIAEVKRLNKVK